MSATNEQKRKEEEESFMNDISTETPRTLEQPIVKDERPHQTRERPIIFFSEMVKALLAGSKAQTRRIVKPQPEADSRQYNGTPNDYWIWKHPRVTEAGYCHTNREAMERLMIPCCPYGVAGDRLRVREQWCALPLGDGDKGSGVAIEYSDGSITNFNSPDWITIGKKPHKKGRPSIHMPRWASRITLEILKVRVERLQDIDPYDAMAEGIDTLSGLPTINAVTSYAALWDSLHGKGAWDKNPYVWVLEFRSLNDASNPLKVKNTKR